MCSEEFYRADRPHRNAVHGRETGVARHAPAAIHGFANLGSLILADAILLKRCVQMDMGQQGKQHMLKVVVARPFALRNNRCPASSPVLNLRADAACWRPVNTAASLAPRGRILEPLGRPQLGCILKLLRRPRESGILEVVGGLQEGWILKLFGRLFILDLLHFNFGSLASCPRFAPQQMPRVQKLKCKRSGMNERTAHRHQVPGRTLLFVFVFSRSSCA